MTDVDRDEAPEESLLRALQVIPHHSIGLRRNKYRVVRRISNELRWNIVKDSEATIVWLDKWSMNDLGNLRLYKVGHFEGIRELATKCAIGRTLNRMRLEFPDEYDFFPLSFELPKDKGKLLAYAKEYAKVAAAARAKRKKGLGLPKAPRDKERGCWPAKGQQPQPQPAAGDRLAFICKPDMSSQGRGIYLAMGLDEIEELQRPGGGDADSDSDSDDDSNDSDDAPPASAGAGTAATVPKRRTMVQAYLPRPLTMDGRKFDFRIYVLVTSAFPTLRVFIYRQGLVRLATMKYEPPSASNSSKRRMFLTNYAVHKAVARAASAASAAASAAAATSVAQDDDDGSISDKSDDADSSSEEDSATATPTAAAPPAFSAPAPPPCGPTPSARRPSTSGTRKRLPQSKRPEPAMPPWATQVNACTSREGVVKWSIQSMLSCMAEQGIDSDLLWSRIKEVITKTLLAVRPHLAQKYRAARPQLRKAEPPPAAVAVMRRSTSFSQRSRSRPHFAGSPRVAALAAASPSFLSSEPLSPGTLRTRLQNSSGPESPLRSARRAVSAGRLSSARNSPASSEAADVSDQVATAALSAGSAAFAQLMQRTTSAGSFTVPADAEGIAAASWTPRTLDAVPLQEDNGRAVRSTGVAPASPSASNRSFRNVAVTVGQAASATGALAAAPGAAAEPVVVPPAYAAALPLSSTFAVTPTLNFTLHRSKTGLGLVGRSLPLANAASKPPIATVTGGGSSRALLLVTGQASVAPLAAFGAPVGGSGTAGGGGKAGGGSMLPLLGQGGKAARDAVASLRSHASSDGGSAGSSSDSVVAAGGSGLRGLLKPNAGPSLPLPLASEVRSDRHHHHRSNAPYAPKEMTSFVSGVAPQVRPQVAPQQSHSGGPAHTGTVPMLHRRLSGTAASTTGSYCSTSTTATTKAACVDQQPHSPQLMQNGTSPGRAGAGSYRATPGVNTAGAASNSASGIDQRRGPALDVAGGMSPGGSSRYRVPASESHGRGPASPVSAASAAPSLFPDDSEQGFRGYELMGLDIILDMSHCTCKNHAEHANISSRPSAQGTRAAPRCQPRPVLLEINQSCSMNSDSVLDRVIKGEALLDGFTLAAPDEQWLIERFIDALSLPSPAPGPGSSSPRGSSEGSRVTTSAQQDGTGSLVSHGAFPSASTATSEDPLSARLARLSRARVTGVSQRASLVGLAEAAANEAAHHAAARSEAAALMRAVSADPFMPALIATLRVPGSDGAKDSGSQVATAAASSAARAPSLASSAGSVPGPPVLRPCTLSTVPWAPLPQGFSLRTVIPSAWQQEVWFGPAAATPPAPPASLTRSAFPFGELEMATNAVRSASGTAGGSILAPLSITGSGAASLTPPRNITAVADAPASQHVSSLGQFQPLSQRAELVLALRRIYEHLHIGGYQQLLPPPTPELARRFRRIAEHVPSSLRETISFTRRRQEALAFRAEKGVKKDGAR